MIAQAAIAFAATFVLDLVWSEYIRAVSSGRASAGAFHAGLIIILGSISTILYVGDHLLAIPAALGGASGTYLSIRRKRAAP